MNINEIKRRGGGKQIPGEIKKWVKNNEKKKVRERSKGLKYEKKNVKLLLVKLHEKKKDKIKLRDKWD